LTIRKVTTAFTLTIFTQYEKDMHSVKQGSNTIVAVLSTHIAMVVYSMTQLNAVVFLKWHLCQPDVGHFQFLK